MDRFAVIGSIFVDVKGFPNGKYIPTGRNIGTVKFVHGGVCRNVAEDFANIGQDVSFVTVFEDDPMGEDVRRRLSSEGVDLRFAETAPCGMGLWLAVFDENGDLAGSISRQPDFSTFERLIDAKGEEIMQSCDSIVLEVDMTESIARKVFKLAKRFDKSVYVIVGNMGVILKHPEFLQDASMFILNEIEAGELFDCTLDPDKPEEVLDIVRKCAAEKHISEIIVTLGKSGCVYCNTISSESGHIPAVPATLVDSTGAGDAFLTAAVCARSHGATLREAAQRGADLAARTICTSESACPRIADFFPAE